MKINLAPTAAPALALVASSLVGIVACTTESEPSGSPGPSGDGGSSGSSGDGGSSSGDGGASSGEPTRGRTEKFGTVGIGRTSGGYSAAASIYEKLVTPIQCQTATEGTCHFSVCDYGALEEDGGGAGEVKFANAGAIEITGAQIPASTVLTPQAEGDYDSKFGEETVWAGGEEIRFQAAGNPSGVGAFAATLKAPLLVTMVAPVAADDRVIISRSADLNLAWSFTGATSGKVFVQVTRIPVPPDDLKRYSVDCAFPAGEKQGKIPASLLARMPETDAAAFLMNTADQQVKDVSGYEMVIDVTTFGAAHKATLE